MVGHEGSVAGTLGLLFALAGEGQQQLKDIDEVQIEREGAEHGELLL
jgi:hypothetical protein